MIASGHHEIGHNIAGTKTGSQVRPPGVQGVSLYRHKGGAQGGLLEERGRGSGQTDAVAVIQAAFIDSLCRCQGKMSVDMFSENVSILFSIPL